jgi:Holliday junction DNA helicase RuvA
VIARLRGRLLRKDTQEAVVDVGGVGYSVTIPVSTFYRLGEPGSEVTLLTHTHVREDALALFGFLTSAEQTLFERLIAVAGVGPRLAISILSGIETPDLVGALRSGDVARLTRIPGVGKKTAERLVVELKDKMAGLEGIEPPTEEPAAEPHEDLVSALLHLGYSRPEAERGVKKAVAQDTEGSFEELLRRTLRVLSGR